jgi:hypothetical protein
MAKTRNTRSTKSKKSSPSVETLVSASVPSSSSALPASAPLSSSSSSSSAPTHSSAVDVHTAASTETLAAPVLEAAVPAPSPEPRAVARADRDLIARRAYELFLRRGAVHSDPMRDWLEAERELGCRAA